MIVMDEDQSSPRNSPFELAYIPVVATPGSSSGLRREANNSLWHRGNRKPDYYIRVPNRRRQLLECLSANS